VGPRRGSLIITVVLLVAGALTGFAQRSGFLGGFSGRRPPFEALPNTPYDGRFAFVRVNYETAPGG
jgi:hypothetical protein